MPLVLPQVHLTPKLSCHPAFGTLHSYAKGSAIAMAPAVDTLILFGALLWCNPCTLSLNPSILCVVPDDPESEWWH